MLQKSIILTLITLISISFQASADSIKIIVFFDTDSTNIQSTEYEKIKAAIAHIKAVSIQSVKITAYCDDTGKSDYNDLLSDRRAENIKQILQTELTKGNNYTIETNGKGSLPLQKRVDIPLKKQRSLNRKAEIIIETKSNIPNIKNFEVGDKFICNNILFVGGLSRLLPESYPALNDLIKTLKENKNYNIKILGHIWLDNRYNHFDTKDRETGEPLSQERARVVCEYLIKNGIDSKRLTYEGLGGKYPLRKGAKYDRRVEVEVVKK